MGFQLPNESADVLISPDTQSFRSGPLSLRVDSGRGTKVLRLHGELDLATAEILRVALRDAFVGDDEVVIDLSELDFIDSTGIAILISAMAEGDGMLRFIPSEAPAVARVLQLTGVQERMQLVD